MDKNKLVGFSEKKGTLPILEHPEVNSLSSLDVMPEQELSFKAEINKLVTKPWVNFSETEPASLPGSERN